jgi:hypothetical protein
MAGKKGWVRDEGGKDHPDTSILLAYTRKQQLEDRLGIRRHVDECPRCLRTCSEYKRTDMVLEVLEQMQSDLSYADVPSTLLLSRIQGEYARYERRLSTRVMRKLEPIQRFGKRGLRAVPKIGGHLKPEMPLSSLGFYIASLVVVVMLVFAIGVVAAIHGGGPFNQYPMGPGATLVVRHDVTVTTRPTATATHDTTAGSGQSKERISICSTDDDRTQSRLRICGYDFKSGDKVALLVTMLGSGQPKQRRPVTVDAHGEFEVTLPVNNCNVPVAIVAHDLTKTKVYSNILHMRFGSCPMPSPNFGNTGKRH